MSKGNRYTLTPMGTLSPREIKFARNSGLFHLNIYSGAIFLLRKKIIINFVIKSQQQHTDNRERE